MLKEERQQKILEILHRDGKVLAGELSSLLEVSEDTIRRDLQDLTLAGKLQRVHGGALPHSPAEAPYRERLMLEPAAKAFIARSALGLIQDGMVILLDGGTTNVLIASLLPAGLQATVVTNNLPAAEALADHDGIKTILVGGQILSSSRVAIGSVALDTLQKVRADLCLLGVCSLHPEVGVSVPDMEEAAVKRMMISRSQEVAAPVTVDKMGKVSAFVVAAIEQLTYLVPDSAIPEEVLQPYRESGITIIQ